MKESIFEKKESIRQEGYFSVSHLLNKVHVAFADGHTESFQILAGKSKNGVMKFQAFGGGAKLTKEGIDFLKHTYGDDIRFREGEEGDDARFYLKLPNKLDDGEVDSDVDGFERSVLEPFASLDSGLIETSIERELKDELPEAVPGLEFQPDSMQLSYAGVVSPRKWEDRGSQRSDGALLYGRIFHLFDLHVTEEQFALLRQSPNIRVLTNDDNQKILSATRNGHALAQLSDGSLVAENIFSNFDSKL